MLTDPLYSATFIFATKQLDDEFHRLDQVIAAAARALPGYPAHLQAKAVQANWLAGYRVVIAQVMRAYGGGESLPGVVAFDAP